MDLNLSFQVDRRRAGSLVESLTEVNKDFIQYGQKQILVRTPRQGRSKSIVVFDSKCMPRSFPVGRLNRYDKKMKQHRGPLSMMSELESIDENGELSDRYK